jgi:outer membrane protein
LLAGALVSLSLPAAAFGPPDPLKTLPEESKTGAVLPGDISSVQCPPDLKSDEPLTLSGAVDIALCNNPQLQASWANIKVQAGALGGAKAAYLPTVSATVNELRSSSETSGSTSTTDGTTVFLSATWRLFDVGGRKANRQSAEALLRAAEAGHAAALQKTQAILIQAYFEAQTAKAAYEARGQAEAIAGETLEATKRRLVRGASAKSDLLQAATAHARAVLEKNRALGNFEKSLSVLVYSMGIPVQTHVVLADDLIVKAKDVEKVEEVEKNLETWLAEAQKNHPAIMAARAQLEAAEKAITIARSAGLPTLDFTANYFRNGYPGQAISPTQSNASIVGFSLSIPVFSGFSNTYKLRSAAAQKEQQAAELRDTELDTLVEVVKAYADAKSSLRNLGASEELIESAKGALDSTRQRYEKGAADILEILNAQSALADASQERIRCVAEWNEFRLKLLAIAGILGRTRLRE